MTRNQLLIILPCTLAIGCGAPKPMRINSDPNQERQERVQDRVEGDNIDAFLSEHPELDAETKKALREGTMSRTDALKHKNTNESR